MTSHAPACPECGCTHVQSSLIGALVVVEAEGGIVLVHPPGGTPEAPASLPGGAVEYAEAPEDAAVRLAREQTGLDIEPLELLTHFVQLGAPFGAVLDFGFRARAVGGELHEDGPEGPAAVYALDALPAIIPIRAANRRVLATYLERRSRSG